MARGGHPARDARDPLGPDDPTRAHRLEWATLLRRSWGIDALRGPKCASRMELIAIVDDQAAARKILVHLGLPTRAPPRGRPWSPQRDLGGVHDCLFVDTPPGSDGADPPAFDG